MPISDYFERTWLSPNSRFSREVWNQYDNVLTYQNRSNNNIEGFHDSELNMRRNFGNFMANGIYGEREIL